MDVKRSGLRAFRYLIFLTFATLLASCSDSGSSDEVACANETDCPVGQRCVSGICQPEIFCTTSVDCDGGYYCQEYTCVPAVACADDRSCPEGFVCTGGYCLPDLDNPLRCQSDEDCGSGKRCDASGTCVEADGDAEGDSVTDGDLGADDDPVVDGDKPSDGDADADKPADGDLPGDGDFTGDEDIPTDGDSDRDHSVDGDLEAEIDRDGDRFEAELDDERSGDDELELSESAESESVEDGDIELETEMEIDEETDTTVDGDFEPDSDVIEAEEEAIICEMQGCNSGSESRAGCEHARTIGRRDAAFNEFGYSVPYGDLCGESNHFDGVAGQNCSGAGPDHAYRLFIASGEKPPTFIWTRIMNATARTICTLPSRFGAAAIAWKPLAPYHCYAKTTSTIGRIRRISKHLLMAGSCLS